MNLPARSLPTMLVLAALLFPWAMGLVVAAHVAAESHHHGPSGVHRVEAVELILHGHHHDGGTPVHRHTLVVANPAPLTIKPSLNLRMPSSLPYSDTLSIPATRLTVAHPDLAHGPPQTLRTVPILRI